MGSRFTVAALSKHGAIANRPSPIPSAERFLKPAIDTTAAVRLMLFPKNRIFISSPKPRKRPSLSGHVNWEGPHFKRFLGRRCSGGKRVAIVALLHLAARPRKYQKTVLPPAAEKGFTLGRGYLLSHITDLTPQIAPGALSVHAEARWLPRSGHRNRRDSARTNNPFDAKYPG